jgi:hypothetical protein
VRSSASSAHRPALGAGSQDEDLCGFLCTRQETSCQPSEHRYGIEAQVESFLLDESLGRSISHTSSVCPNTRYPPRK